MEDWEMKDKTQGFPQVISTSDVPVDCSSLETPTTSPTHDIGAALEVAQEVRNEGTDSVWMRRHLSDSIYLWACGEKADDEDGAPTLSERIIGWLILFMQGFAYTMLIVLARATSEADASSSGDDVGDSSQLLPSVTGAMYLLVASTTHDLSACLALLIKGLCATHRAFGIGLLVVHGFMVGAAMTVLVSTSDDSASVVLNAVTVLFIADLDEKALKFFLTVPRKWRLFWAVESIGISYALALVAIVYIGGASALIQENNDLVETFPTWFVWGTNPIAVTLSCGLFTSTLEAVGNFWNETWASVEKSASRSLVGNLIVVILAAMVKANGCLREEPYFYAILGIWCVHGIASVFIFSVSDDFPIAFKFVPIASSDDQHKIALSDNILAFIYVNVLLALGFLAKTLGVCLPLNEKVSALPEELCSSADNEPRGIWVSCAGSRVPSVLIGWGVGYWANSLLYLLACSWEGGGWNNAPTIASVVSYVALPSFSLAYMFMFADPNLLGTRCGAFLKPAIDRMKNRRRIEFWIMASVLRDILSFWIALGISWGLLVHYHWL